METGGKNEEIARRLTVTRRALGFDSQRGQTDFVEALNSVLPMTVARWNHYETGRSMLTVPVALALCARFDLSLDWLYRGKRGDLPSRIAKAIEDVEAYDMRRNRIRRENNDPSPEEAR